jgi:phosphoglycolate phosphatase
VLFDLDGTLLDTAPDMGAALNMLLAENGHGVPWGIVTSKPGWLTEPLPEHLALHGRAAGMRAAFARYGYHESPPDDYWGAETAVDSLFEFARWLAARSPAAEHSAAGTTSLSPERQT